MLEFCLFLKGYSVSWFKNQCMLLWNHANLILYMWYINNWFLINGGTILWGHIHEFRKRCMNHERATFEKKNWHE